MTDRELLELISSQMGTLSQDVKGLREGQNNLENRFDNFENRFDNFENRFDNFENRFDNLEKKVDSIDKAVIRIENDNNIQHTALFDGWKQNTQQLERIEKEVTKQEEIIMRRVK
jgi:chromosome segregation ATPase